MDSLDLHDSAKLDDHDVWRLRSTHFGSGFDFDSQT